MSLGLSGEQWHRWKQESTVVAMAKPKTATTIGPTTCRLRMMIEGTGGTIMRMRSDVNRFSYLFTSVLFHVFL